VIRPGEPWGAPATGTPDARGAGDDTDLAHLVAAHRGARLGFEPDDRCDLARAVGLTNASPGGYEVPVDALDVASRDLAVNLVVLGRPPDRLRAGHRRRPVTVLVDGQVRFDGSATTVVIANGQFLRGADLVPRGHPGDGRLEVQIYAVAPAARAELRRRLPGGAHLPHPQIVTTTGRTVDVTWRRPAPLEVDGRPAAPAQHLEVQVVPGAFRLLV
jgi:hypothetical protein